MLLMMMIVRSFLQIGLLKPPFPKLDRFYDHLNLRAMKKVLFERMQSRGVFRTLANI